MLKERPVHKPRPAAAAETPGKRSGKMVVGGRAAGETQKSIASLFFFFYFSFCLVALSLLPFALCLGPLGILSGAATSL